MAARVRKIPQRTCIGCQTVKNKKELIRIVRTPELEVLVDATGKKAGRGCYICPQTSCLEKAFNGNYLENKLGISITPELKEQLKADLGAQIAHEEYS